jgi:hypothetical protein
MNDFPLLQLSLPYKRSSVGPGDAISKAGETLASRELHLSITTETDSDSLDLGEICVAIYNLAADRMNPLFLAGVNALCNYGKVPSNPILPEIMDYHILPILLELLNDPYFVHLSLRCISILTAHEDEISDCLVNHQFCHAFLELCDNTEFLPLLISSLSNIAGSTDFCRGAVLNTIPLSTLFTLFEFLANIPVARRSLLKCLMSLAKFPTLGSSAVQLFQCFSTFVGNRDPSLSILALWGFHYLLGNHQIAIACGPLFDHVLQLIEIPDDAFRLIACYLLKDLLGIEPTFALQFGVSLLLPSLNSGNSEVVRVATLCVRDYISIGIRDHHPNCLGSIAFLIERAPYLTKLEAGFLFCGFLDMCTVDLYEWLFQNGAVSLLVSLLDVDHSLVLRAAVRNLVKLFNSGIDCSETLESLRSEGVIDSLWSRTDDELLSHYLTQLELLYND